MGRSLESFLYHARDFFSSTIHSRECCVSSLMSVACSSRDFVVVFECHPCPRCALPDSTKIVRASGFGEPTMFLIVGSCKDGDLRNSVRVSLSTRLALLSLIQCCIPFCCWWRFCDSDEFESCLSGILYYCS